MTKLDLFDKETALLISKLEDEILEVIDNRDQFTRSDLQGVVTAQVIKILETGLKLAEQH